MIATPMPISQVSRLNTAAIAPKVRLSVMIVEEKYSSPTTPTDAAGVIPLPEFGVSV